MRAALQASLVAACLACAACATTSTESLEEEGEPVLVAGPAAPQTPQAGPQQPPKPVQGVPPAGAETARPQANRPEQELEEVVVQAARERHEAILDFVAEAQSLLRDVDLQYVFVGKGRRETLRGRPVAFALWSDARKEWSVAHLEIPRPPIKWKPGGKELPFIVTAPTGVTARHVRGTGAERLMFSFSRDGEPLKVYGRKFPVFDDYLIARKRWRDVVRTAIPIVYLPANDDTLDPQFVNDGKAFLLGTAQRAIEELRRAQVPSLAFPGELLADVIPASVIAALGVIEQTDDSEYVAGGTAAFERVLSQYGLKREEAYRYSVSRAKALGPMQFTNRRGNGTYAMVVRRCPAAQLDPYFERGATNLLNAMKAAICLFDLELSQMRQEIRGPYRDNPLVLGIFPVAAYNGGPRNVGKLYGVMQRLGVKPEELRPPGQQAAGNPVTCPCLWQEQAGIVRPVAIPRYNNENRWYVEKYQSILHAFE